MRHRRTPRTAPATDRSPFTLPAIALLIVSSCADVAWGNASAENPASRKERFERTIRALTTGPMAGRLEASQGVGALFGSPADETDEEDAPDPEDVAEAILDVIAGAPDDFLGWSIVDRLTVEDGPGVADVMVAALQNDSLNVRSAALPWFASNLDWDATSILEDLWDGGVPEWARADLIAALASHASSTHLADFLSLTADPDPEVRLAAIGALGTAHDAAALPRLLELARTGDRFERERALAAMPAWTGSDEAFSAVLDASRAGDPLQRSAVRLLGSFDRHEAEERLLQTLADRSDLLLRVTAAQALGESVHPDATDSIVALLADPEVRNDEWALSSVLEVLKERDDAAVLPRLQEILDAGEFEDLEGMEELMTYLGRTDRQMGTTSTSTSSDGLDVGFLWHVAAPNGWRSIRCVDGPAMPSQSWLHPRIRDGSLVTIAGRFDRHGETWASIANHPISGCWVPVSYLERGVGPGERPIDPFTVELDLPAAALLSRSARRLIRNGILEPFDADAEVIAVVLRPRRDGPPLEAIVTSMDAEGADGEAEDMLGVFLERLDAAYLEASDAPDDSEEED